MTGNAIPPALRDAPLVEVLVWADCYLRHDEAGWVAVDARTGAVISDARPLADRLAETWAWLRAAEGRFAEFEALERARRQVRLEAHDQQTGERCGALLGALGYEVEVRCAG